MQELTGRLEGWSQALWEGQFPVSVQPSHLLPMLISFLVVNMEGVPKCHPFPPRGVAHVEGWGGLCCRGQVEQMALPKWEEGSEHLSVFIVCQ